MNKNIIIAILIVLIIAVVGIFIFTGSGNSEGKLNTQITFLNKDTLKNGEQIQIELKDEKGTVLAGETLIITYEENGNNQNYSVITDSNGKCYLTLNNEPAGQHNVKVSYNGSEKYNGCTFEKTITIEEGTATETAQTNNENASANTVVYNNESATTENSQQAIQTYYDAELNVYYDANGRIIGGQSDGSNIYDLRNNPPEVVDGSLV